MSLFEKTKDVQYDKSEMLDSIKARDIVRVIMDYGVNDNQVRKIIKFLSLELEDISLASKLSSLLDGIEEDDSTETKVSNKPKLEF
jgi:hypothetical protein